MPAATALGFPRARTYTAAALPRLWFDSLTHDPETLRFLLARAGAERVMLGTDYPFAMGEARPGKTIRVPAWSYPAYAPQCGNNGYLLDTLDGRLEHAVSAFDPRLGTMAVWTVA